MQRRTGSTNWLWLAAAFAVGLLIGWIVLGWWLFPVNWTDASVKDLRQEQRYQYLSLVADSYLANGDLGLAGERLQQWTPQEAVDDLNAAASALADAGRAAQAQNLQTLAAALATTLAPGAQPTTVPQAPDSSPGLGSVLLLLGGIVVLGAGVGLVIYVLTSRRPKKAAPPPTQPAAEGTYRTDDEFGEADEALMEPAWYTHEEPPPIDETARDFYEEEEFDFPPAPAAAVPAAAQSQPSAAPPASSAVAAGPATRYIVHYRQGDVDYDENFMIESQSGSGYRGECGMGIAETLENDPTKPTAMDVWLFDKGDVRTKTTVLLSDFAFGSADLRQRLRDKGDVILVSPGQVFRISHKTLDLEGRIAELTYAEGPGPAKSVFRTLRVELTVTPRQ
jgi:hypothetical protein